MEELGNAEEGELNSSAEARKLAFYLFWNIKPYFDRNFIIQEDLEHFLSAKKAAQAFTLLDVDGDGKARVLQLVSNMPLLHSEALSRMWFLLNIRYLAFGTSKLRKVRYLHGNPLQVSLHDIRDSVINIYRERKFLAATLRDTRTVVSRLELVIGVVVHLVFLFFYLLIFRVRLACLCCFDGDTGHRCVAEG